MILPIILFGDPVLRTVGGRVEKITDEIKGFVADMIETMRDAEGVGLAAQQVAVPLQIAVIDVSGIEDRPSKMWVGGSGDKMQIPTCRWF
jgi:peptide deformylase